MSKSFVFVAMIFCHVLDDFVLQAPCLSNLKQKSWWEDNAPDDLYKRDYTIGLIAHSLSWAFSIMFPIAVYLNFDVGVKFILVWLVNALTHIIVDDMKANRHKISLVTDQAIHFIQIVFTFFEIVF